MYYSCKVLKIMYMLISEIKIETIALIISTFSLYIAYKTLKSNNEMIENSTRPYISIYLTETNYSNRRVNLVIRNFGASSGEIMNITYTKRLKNIISYEGKDPLAKLKRNTFAPGQNIVLFSILRQNVEEYFIDVEEIEILYKGPTGKMYKEIYNINFEATCDVIPWKPLFVNSKNPELKQIVWTLRDMANRNL